MEIDNYSVIHKASSRHSFIEYCRRMWISFRNNLPNIAFLPTDYLYGPGAILDWSVGVLGFVKVKTCNNALRVRAADRCWFMSLCWIQCTYWTYTVQIIPFYYCRASWNHASGGCSACSGKLKKKKNKKQNMNYTEIQVLRLILIYLHSDSYLNTTSDKISWKGRYLLSLLQKDREH